MLSIGWLPFAHTANAGSCADVFSSIIEPSKMVTFSSAEAVLVENLRARFPSFHNSDLSLTVSSTETKRPGLMAVVTFQGKYIGEARVYHLRDMLRFDVKVEPEFRRIGLNQYLFAWAMDQYPDIKYIPSRMAVGNSDNAKFFMNWAFGSAESFNDLLSDRSVFLKLTPQQVQESEKM